MDEMNYNELGARAAIAALREPDGAKRRELNGLSMSCAVGQMNQLMEVLMPTIRGLGTALYAVDQVSEATKLLDDWMQVMDRYVAFIQGVARPAEFGQMNEIQQMRVLAVIDSWMKTFEDWATRVQTIATEVKEHTK